MKKLETRKEILDCLEELSKEKIKRMKLIAEERSKIYEGEWDSERMGELVIEFNKLNIENHLLYEIQMSIMGKEF